MKIFLTSVLLMLCWCSAVSAQTVSTGTENSQMRCETIIKDCQQALSAKHSRKDRYDVLMKLARTYADMRNYEKAIETGQEAITLFPKKDAAHLLVAQVYQQSELYELSRQEYLTVLRYDRKSFNAYFSIGQLYMQQGLMTRAMEYFRKAIVIKPTTELYREMSRCAENASDLGLSISLLQKALYHEERYDDLVHLGKLYEETKNYDASEKILSQAIKLSPERIEGYLNVGLLYLRNNDLSHAEHFLRIALEKAPEEGSIHFFLAVISFHQGKMGEALRENAEAKWLSRSDVLTAYTYKFDHLLTAAAKKQ
ncbi:MAG: tetratricopeptide repeat protein [Endomicrobiales bacterium]|jgi:tetratricopeptide (TPR) repeat protein